jgi:hypothetical protein
VPAKNAKPYLNSNHIFKFLELMDIPDGKSCEQQLQKYKKGVDRGGMYFSFLQCLDISAEKYKKGSGPEFSLVSRASLLDWLVVQAIADPVCVT